MPTTFLTVMRLNKILFGLLILGIFFRLVPVVTGNIFFWFDQGLDSILVKQLVVDHRLNLVSRYSGLAGVLMGPVWTWLMALPFAVSRGNPASFSVFLSLVSIGSSVFTFGFIKKHFGVAAALIAAGITLTAPIFVFNSVTAASPHPLTFLFILFIWAAYELFANGKAIFWVPLLFLTGLFFQFEIGFALFCLPAIFVLMVVFRRQPFNRYFFIGAALMMVTFLPQILFDLRHDFLISKGILKIFSGSNSLYGDHSPLPLRFLERAWSFGDDFLTMIILVRDWLIVSLTLILSVWGWRRQKNKELLKILLVILGVFYVGFSFYPGPFWAWYRAGLPIVYALLVAVPLGTLWEKVRFTRLIIPVILLIIFTRAFGINTKTDTGDVAMVKTQTAVLDYVYQSADGRPFYYFAYTPPVYDYLWQYDFWWYGQRKYGYLPVNFQLSIPLLGIGQQATLPKGDEGLFFLIVEPNRDTPGEPMEWRVNRVKVGKILEIKNFPGDVVVEKRTTE